MLQKGSSVVNLGPRAQVPVTDLDSQIRDQHEAQEWQAPIAFAICVMKPDARFLSGVWCGDGKQALQCPY